VRAAEADEEEPGQAEAQREQEHLRGNARVRAPGLLPQEGLGIEEGGGGNGEHELRRILERERG
jgi:hypothetical protein